MVPTKEQLISALASLPTWETFRNKAAGTTRDDQDFNATADMAITAALLVFDECLRNMASNALRSKAAGRLIAKALQVKGPTVLLQAQDMLYPQYDDHRDLEYIQISWLPWLQATAQERLKEAEQGEVAPRVKARWELLASGVLPDNHAKIRAKAYNEALSDVLSHLSKDPNGVSRDLRYYIEGLRKPEAEE